MEQWDKKCTVCNSKDVDEDPIDVYYDKNPSVYYCSNCGSEITVEMVPVVTKTIKRTHKQRIGEKYPDAVCVKNYRTTKYDIFLEEDEKPFVSANNPTKAWEQAFLKLTTIDEIHESQE